jgi:hypothetical protein
MHELICGRCKQALYWEVCINGAGEDVGWSVHYQTIEGDSVICEKEPTSTHLVNTPTAVKAVIEFVGWLNEQVQEEAMDREHGIS